MIRNTKILLVAAAVLLAAVNSTAQAQSPNGQPNPFLPISNEPAPEIFVDQPIAEPLAVRGVAIIPYRTENFRILPIFGPAATNVSPRAGHLHVTVDDLPWHWADVGNAGSIVVAGLPAGRHKVLIEIATPEHHVLAGQAISFTVPEAHSQHH